MIITDIHQLKDFILWAKDNGISDLTINGVSVKFIASEVSLASVPTEALQNSLEKSTKGIIVTDNSIDNNIIPSWLQPKLSPKQEIKK